MKVAIIYNKDLSGVINTFGMQNKEVYDPSTVQRVADALEKGGHNVAVIDGNMHLIDRLQAFMPRVMMGERMGMVFNMAYGIQGESRYTHIPSMLEMLGIPYVGSSPSGHALALDKVITKIIMQKHGLPTPDFWVFSSAEDDMSSVKYPVIVKPKMESVSFGLKVVYNESDLRKAVSFIISEFDQQALVEQFIRGREFAVGVLGNQPSEVFPVLEIDLDNDPDAIQTVDNKKTAPRKKVCPAVIPDELARKMQQLSVEAFNALQLRDFSRVDIRLDEDSNIYLLEINSMASLGRTGSYVHAAGKHGYNFEQLVLKMLDVAAVRYFSDTFLPKEDEKGKKDSRKGYPARIRGFLRSRHEQNTGILNQIVDINTHVRNTDGVNKVGMLMQKQLSTLGFTSEVFSQVELGNSLFFRNTAGNELDVLFLGNIDNAVKSARHEYFDSGDQKMTGTAIWESKGGLVVMLQALQALRFTRQLRKKRIGIFLASDNSIHNQMTRKKIREISSSAPVVIGLHGGSLQGSLVTSRPGGAVYRCEMNLKKNLDASYLSKSIIFFTKAISRLSELSDTSRGILVVPSSVNLQANINQVYAGATARLSIRYDDPDFISHFEKQLRSAFALKNRKYLSLTIDGGDTRPPMQQNEMSTEFWKKIKALAEDLDIRITEEHRWSSGAIGLVEPGRVIIDGFGPVGTDEHGRSEYILSHSLHERAVLLAMTILKLS